MQAELATKKVPIAPIKALYHNPINNQYAQYAKFVLSNVALGKGILSLIGVNLANE